MPLHPTWQDIGLRLVLTLVAGAVIGFNRGTRGHAAGLRTTMLVGLAAAVSMIQANFLLSVVGKTAESFGLMDVMRLPLGILTGVGFIGAGTILRRGDLVTGVTTAATLWMMTMIGLCFGAGQLGVGLIATGLVVSTLWGFQWLDLRLPREQRALLVIEVSLDSIGTLASDLAKLIEPLGYRSGFVRQCRDDRRVDVQDVPRNRVAFEISWKRPEIEAAPLDLVKAIGACYSVVSFELRPQSRH